MRKLERLTCPHCGAQHDQAASVGARARPKPGDVSICVKCAGVAIFTTDGAGARKATKEERAEIEADPRVRASLDVLRGMKAAR